MVFKALPRPVVPAVALKSKVVQCSQAFGMCLPSIFLASTFTCIEEKKTSTNESYTDSNFSYKLVYMVPDNACFLPCQNLCTVLITLATLLLVTPFLVNVASSLAKKSQNLTR